MAEHTLLLCPVTLFFLTLLQPGLSHLLYEEEGSERFGRPEHAGVSLWMVRDGLSFLMCPISDDSGLLSSHCFSLYAFCKDSYHTISMFSNMNKMTLSRIFL